MSKTVPVAASDGTAEVRIFGSTAKKERPMNTERVTLRNDEGENFIAEIVHGWECPDNAPCGENDFSEVPSFCAGCAENFTRVIEPLPLFGE